MLAIPPPKPEDGEDPLRKKRIKTEQEIRDKIKELMVRKEKVLECYDNVDALEWVLGERDKLE